MPVGSTAIAPKAICNHHGSEAGTEVLIPCILEYQEELVQAKRTEFSCIAKQGLTWQNTGRLEQEGGTLASRGPVRHSLLSHLHQQYIVQLPAVNFICTTLSLVRYSTWQQRQLRKDSFCLHLLHSARFSKSEARLGFRV